MKSWISVLKDLWIDMNSGGMSLKETVPFLNLKNYMLGLSIFLVFLYFSNGWVFYIILFLFIIYLLILTLKMHAVKHFWILALDNNDDLNKNREYILLAIKHREEAEVLMHASKDLRSEKKIVLKAIQSDSSAFKYASDELREDREFMLEVLRIDGEALWFMIDEITDDRELVLEAVKNYGGALGLVVDSLKSDREIVLEAVKNDPSAFEFASEALQNDVELKKIAGKI